MDGFSSNNLNKTDSWNSKPSNTGSSGLKLVLPPLKSIFGAKTSKKSNHRTNSISYPPPVENVIEIVEKKPPRPAKLKPLKEVLSKLISQIQKKDDYAFFLKPVDAASIPGYLDVVKHPMDLGTMSDKVHRGRYRSLEEFASDLKLVTTNAKIFNPPGSIYYTEAEKIESWSMEHITRAASTVIQHESDWNIDIEKEDDTPTVNVEDEEEDRMEVDEQSRARSMSVTSQPPPTSTTTRRGPRGPYKKQNQSAVTQVSESLDAEGRMPGSKDGVGAFPAESDWAKVMLQLKLKGKKYKTKKERMKIEKEGPPTLPEGSIDYSEMEDPFTVLQNLVPDPPSRPALTPLYPPLFINETLFYPAATSIPLHHVSPTVPSEKRRHWSIARNTNARHKAKEREDEAPESTEGPSWQVPREAHTTDFGSFSLLAGELAEEMRRRGMTPCTVLEGQEQDSNFDLVREGLEPVVAPATTSSYWTPEKAIEGEAYIRDLVYGGVDGLAYVRSLAEFMQYGSDGVLPLAKWVEEHVVDELTGGRHKLLRETADAVLGRTTPAGQAAKSLFVYPGATAALNQLRAINTHKIDMAALIKVPNELFLSEDEWHGKELKERRAAKSSAAAGAGKEAMEVEEPEPSWMTTASSAELEGPEELKEVLDYVAAVIIDLNRRSSATRPLADDGAEDPVMRNLRLNLLALAKRAPLDTIARLPEDLVPEHIRQFVPTLAPTPAAPATAPPTSTSTLASALAS